MEGERGKAKQGWILEEKAMERSEDKSLEDGAKKLEEHLSFLCKQDACNLYFHFVNFFV